MKKEFEVHMLTTTGIKKAHELAVISDALLTRITDDYCPNTREFSIVKTKLEEACFFAKKSMALGNVLGKPEDGTPEQHRLGEGFTSALPIAKPLTD